MSPNPAKRLPTGISKRGESYRVRIRVNGEQVQATFPTREQAEAFHAEQMYRKRTGTWIDPRDGNMRFETFAREWQAKNLHHRDTTAKQIESRLTRHILPHLGAMRLNDIRRSDCQRVLTVAAQHLAPSTVRVVLVTMRSVLTAAVADEMIAKDPSVGVNIPRIPARRVDVLTDAQIAHIADRLPEQARAMFALALATGMRQSELRGLTVDRITPALHVAGVIVPQQAVITVDRAATVKRGLGPTKTDSAIRDITIGASTVTTLRDHLQRYGIGDDGLVFHSRRQVTDSSTLAAWWRTATKGLGLPDGTGWHLCRHTHATRLLAAGVNIAAVARRLGHASPTITLRAYAWVLPSDEQRIIDLIEGTA